jgi:hypothetical protein
MLQRAVDWMFPMTIEWFGLPDDMKRHSGQLDYRLKGKTNDELRQTWMASTVPSVSPGAGRAPAHYDEATEKLRPGLSPSPAGTTREEAVALRRGGDRVGARSSSGGRGGAP